jgi:hypothetical protein
MRRNRNVTLTELRAALEATHNVRRHAAALLGVTETALAKQIAQFRMEGEEFPKPDQTMWHKPNWEPTEEEIEAACGVIQAGWNNRERMMRAMDREPPWEPPVVVLDDDSRDAEW